MSSNAHDLIRRYRQAHSRVYGYPPRELRRMSDGFLLHGLVVTEAEFVLLAEQLEAEAAVRLPRRGLLRRALDWLNADVKT
jgi:hypothetical protein